ncbi:unnamed protein product [Tetraodon nigroviridis]|uniref:Chromosome undetermined SCAF14656, whole genome shotgun sequence n=1 Tax=Tetraodon nigroviridis TaxID=99883 RepID=Q4SCE2_TETNG|nr:unnamed protein product [Tetraodon nigroviridis]
MYLYSRVTLAFICVHFPRDFLSWEQTRSNEEKAKDDGDKMEAETGEEGKVRLQITLL